MGEIRKRNYSSKSNIELETLLKKKLQENKKEIKEILEELSKRSKNKPIDIINRIKTKPKKTKLKNKMDIKYIIN